LPIQSVENAKLIFGSKYAISLSRVEITATILSRQLGRKVVDKTGLEGNYDLKLKWSPDETQSSSGPDNSPTSAVPNAPPPDSSGPSIFAAIQEQLGLRLESGKGPGELPAPATP
jgi:uncharacterized protein (TIGR03435 family)